MISSIFAYIESLHGEIEERRALRQLKVRAVHDLYTIVKNAIPIALSRFTKKSKPSINFDDLDLDDLKSMADLETPSETGYQEAPRTQSRTEILDMLRAALENYEQEKYIRQPDQRIELGDDRIAYEASSVKLIKPGDTEGIRIGIGQPVEGTGWPGLPATQHMQLGVMEDFQPIRIKISPGFEMIAAFGGSQNLVSNVPGTGIPSEHLITHPQPKFPVVHRGLTILIEVRNATGQQRPCTVRVEGLDVSGNTFPKKPINDPSENEHS